LGASLPTHADDHERGLSHRYDHGKKGSCDDRLATAFAPNRDAQVLLVKAFKAGEPVALANTPATPAPPVAPVDLCLIKVLVGPGHPGTEGAPSTSKGIGIEIWLPAPEHWNGRIRDIGSGGWAGGDHGDPTRIGSRAIILAGAAKGYAGSASDHGHSNRNIGGSSGSFAMKEDGTINTALWRDFAERSLEQMALASRAAVKTYYGKRADYTYWDGYSTGGRQGYKLAQKYPHLYDGILAGAPAFNWTRFITNELYPQIVMQRFFGAPIATAKLNFVSTRSVAACDALGLGFILDPLQCRYDPTRDAQALCSGVAGNGVVGAGTNVNCVNVNEAQALNRMWYGQTADGSYVDPQIDNAPGPYLATSNHLWFGLARGTSLGLLAGAAQPFTISSDVVALSLQNPAIAHTNFFNATGNGQALWKGLSFAQLADAYYRGLALQPEFSFINTDDPDLRGLRRAGGKVLSYHGLADDLIAPQGSLNYYARVVATMGGHEKVQRFNRLYLIPGMAHDGSFSRTGTFDPATGAITSPNKVPQPQAVAGRDELFVALRNWVEKGEAPGRIDVSSANGSVTMPICVYPKQAQHDGSGDPKLASSYQCRYTTKGLRIE
jgi:feruloyl esterase